MTDVLSQIPAVHRSLRTLPVDGEPSRVQSLAQEYPAAIAEVWDAVTSADRIERWFLPVTGDLRAGGTYQLTGNAGGTIERCSPPSAGTAGYRVTWEYGGGVSWLEVSLQELGDDGTRFELTHIARADSIPAEFWDLYGPGATGVGWDQMLLGLSLNLRGDASISPSEAEAWMLSDEGRTFSRRAADAWAQAHIADGGDPDAAARAADATFAFYTGQG